MFRVLTAESFLKRALNAKSYALFLDINECLSLPCQNGGTCNNEVNKYTCTCLGGYSGTNCETGISIH